MINKYKAVTAREGSTAFFDIKGGVFKTPSL